MKSDFAMDEFHAAVPLLAKAIAAGGDRDASAQLQGILDTLKHFRRIKVVDKDAAIPIEEVG